ncbi:hypothetical protein Dimus_007039 [Dionaea muscipula]
MEMNDHHYQYPTAADLRCFTTTNLPPTPFPSSATFVPQPPHPADFFPPLSDSSMALPFHHAQHPAHNPFDMLIGGLHAIVPPHSTGGGGSSGVGLHVLPHDSTTTTAATTMASMNNADNIPADSGGGYGNFGGFEGGGGGGLDGGNRSTCRWRRQETLILLEIRIKLDHRFKEAHKKAPLWDEVSRLMYEEHGYQRTGKKCKEKIENLYKYYKKCKDRMAGQPDGKPYRFFLQLEALFAGDSCSLNAASSSSPSPPSGDGAFIISPNNNNNNNNNQVAATGTGQFQQAIRFSGDSLISSLSISSGFTTSTSSDDDQDRDPPGPGRRGGGSAEGGQDPEKKKEKKNMRKRKKKKEKKRNWELKMKEFIDSQMETLMEKQQAWVDKMTRALEHREQERMRREEEWRKQEAERAEIEHKFWVNERAWIDARNAAIVEALEKLLIASSSCRMNKLRGASSSSTSSSDVDKAAGDHRWPETAEMEMPASLVNLRIQGCGSSMSSSSSSLEDTKLWEEIASKMQCLGYHTSAMVCKEKWDAITNTFVARKKMRKEIQWRRIDDDDHRNNNVTYNIGSTSGGGAASAMAIPDASHCGHHHGNVNAVGDGCFRFLVREGEDISYLGE